MLLQVDRRIGGRPRFFLAREREVLLLVPDLVRRCVVYLCLKTTNTGLPLPRATGFLVGVENEKAGVFYYLVTARHNIESFQKADRADDKVHVRVNLNTGRWAFVETKISDWTWHPDDPSIDITVLPFQVADEMDLNYIPTEMFVTNPSVADYFGLGDEFFIRGVFRSHFGTERNIPIVRIGNIAAMPDDRVEMAWAPKHPMEAFIIESRSIGGLSGSPVFLHFSPYGSGKRGSKDGVAGREFYLLGLVHGHFDLPLIETDFDTTDDSNEPRKALHTGMAIVTPAAKLLGVLQLPQLAAQRERIIEEKMAPYRGIPD